MVKSQDKMLVEYLHGPYDLLYAAREILWPDKPGRMVKLAATKNPPGKCLDLGCGDGKNIVYLKNLGWDVDGLDISNLAIRAAKKRLHENRIKNARIWCQDVRRFKFLEGSYDLIISYGLYHCLDDEDLMQVHMNASRALRKGGIFALAMFDNRLPIPHNHHTGPLYLRPMKDILDMFSDWDSLSVKIGEIEEDHLPLVGKHRHSVVWGLFEKRGTDNE